MKKLIILALLSLISHCSVAIDLGKLDGIWSRDCEYQAGMLNFDERGLTMSFYQHQVKIKLKIKKMKSDTFLYFDEMLETGFVGASIKWNDVSKVDPVAKATNIKEGSFDLEIFGLTSIELNEIKHTLYRFDNPSKMVRCD